MKTRIHVNQHIIKANRANGENNPVLSIIRRGKTTHAHRIDIMGPAQVIYSPNKPLSCGATVWIETESEVLTSGDLVVE